MLLGRAMRRGGWWRENSGGGSAAFAATTPSSRASRPSAVGDGFSPAAFSSAGGAGVGVISTQAALVFAARAGDERPCALSLADLFFVRLGFSASAISANACLAWGASRLLG